MTTPEEPELSTPPADPEELELVRRWRERAELAWPDSVPVFEFLHETAWGEAAALPAHLLPLGVRVLGFASRGSAERGPLLEVRCRDAVRAFEGALWALPRYMPAGTPPDPDPRPPGALTKAVERSELRAEVVELRKQVEELGKGCREDVTHLLERVGQHDKRLAAQFERLNRLDAEPLPADVRVLSDRIDSLEHKLGQLGEQSDFERLERNLDETDDALTNHKREVSRRLGRLEADVTKLEDKLETERRRR